MSVPFTVYERPHGTKIEAEITKISDDDADWFKANDIKISGEDAPIGMIFYFDYGATIQDEDTPNELIKIARMGTDPFKFFTEAREKITELMEKLDG